jgi:hypothetical protein
VPQVVTNMTDRLVLVRLRSGATVHLGGGQSSPELEDADVLDNPRLAPLLERAVVRVDAVSGAGSSAPEKSGGRTGRRRSTRADETDAGS